jgi:hypothetical protein
LGRLGCGWRILMTVYGFLAVAVIIAASGKTVTSLLAVIIIKYNKEWGV